MDYAVIFSPKAVGDLEDTMSSRIVDNADFFHINNFGKITDKQLYERLLNYFSSWMKWARAKGVLR